VKLWKLSNKPEGLTRDERLAFRLQGYCSIAPLVQKVFRFVLGVLLG
jgi:hypothetical protein